jgi:hypothetical protein
VSRWSIRERLRHSVREHAWIWKAPFLFATVTIWVGGILLFLSPWQGDSRSPDRIRTVPSPASVEPDDSAGERGPLFTDPSRNGTAADGRQGGDSEPTDVGAPAPTGSALEVVSTLDVPVTGAVETASAATTRRSTGPTPAPPTVTSSAPVTAPVTAPAPGPPTVTVAPPTTRPPTVTIARPSAPPTTPPVTTSPPVTPPATVSTTDPSTVALPISPETPPVPRASRRNTTSPPQEAADAGCGQLGVSGVPPGKVRSFTGSCVAADPNG